MSLKLLNEQSNDAKILLLTDDSTWGTAPLPAVSTITSVQLQIWYKTVNDQDYQDDPYTIDYTFTTPTQSELVFSITSDLIGLGTDQVLTDGVYKIQYIASDGTGIDPDPWDFDSALELLLDANIRNEVDKKVGKIPFLYYANNNYYTKTIDDALLSQSLYDGMNANAYVAQQDGILTVLETLQRQTD